MSASPFDGAYVPMDSWHEVAGDDFNVAGKTTAFLIAIVGFVVLFLVIVALFPSLASALENYAAEDTTFGPILEDIVPILIGAALMLLAVGVFLGLARTR